MNKKFGMITSAIVILFIAFIVIYVNKTMANNGATADNGNAAANKVDNITQANLVKELNNADVTIVDLREPFLYKKSHVPNSINIPFADFQNRFKELDSNKQIIFVCHEGSMGEASGQFLLQKGFKHVSNLGGGMAQWTGPLEK